MCIAVVGSVEWNGYWNTVEDWSLYGDVVASDDVMDVEESCMYVVGVCGGDKDVDEDGSLLIISVWLIECCKKIFGFYCEDLLVK